MKVELFAEDGGLGAEDFRVEAIEGELPFDGLLERGRALQQFEVIVPALLRLSLQAGLELDEVREGAFGAFEGAAMLLEGHLHITRRALEFARNCAERAGGACLSERSFEPQLRLLKRVHTEIVGLRPAVGARLAFHGFIIALSRRRGREGIRWKAAPQRPAGGTRRTAVHAARPYTPHGEGESNMPETTRTPSGKYPQPAPVHVLDLEREADRLLAELPGRSRRSENIARESGVSLVLMALEGGHRLDDHAAQGVVTVHVLRGRATVRADGTERELGPGQVVLMQPGVRHDVIAGEQAVILLTVTGGAA